MPTTTPALIADSATSGFRQGTIERRDLRPDDIRIDIAFAGICHSDIHTVREEWGPAHFPLTVVTRSPAPSSRSVTRSPATRSATGSASAASSTRAASVSRARTAWSSSAPPPSAPTTPQGYDGEWTMGGYAQEVVVSERFVLRIPDGIGLDVAAPLLCAGITVWSPLRRWGAGPVHGRRHRPRRARPHGREAGRRPRRRGDRVCR